MKTKNFRYTSRSIIGSILCWVFTLVYAVFIILYGIASLTNRRFFSQFMPPIIRFWAGGCLWLMGIDLCISGKERLLARAPRIVCLNHQSALDLVWPGFILSPGAFALGKKELKFVPGVNFVWFATRCVFIDRKNKEKAINTMFEVGRRISSENASLLIAPEGTRSRSGEILPFKKGAFRLAAEHHIPIYPVVVAGAYEAMPPRILIAKQGIIKVNCLEPIDTSNWKIDTVLEHMQEVRNKMVEAYASLRRDL